VAARKALLAAIKHCRIKLYVEKKPNMIQIIFFQGGKPRKIN